MDADKPRKISFEHKTPAERRLSAERKISSSSAHRGFENLVGNSKYGPIAEDDDGTVQEGEQQQQKPSQGEQQQAQKLPVQQHLQQQHTRKHSHQIPPTQRRVSGHQHHGGRMRKVPSESNYMLFASQHHAAAATAAAGANGGGSDLRGNMSISSFGGYPSNKLHSNFRRITLHGPHDAYNFYKRSTSHAGSSDRGSRLTLNDVISIAEYITLDFDEDDEIIDETRSLGGVSSKAEEGLKQSEEEGVPTAARGPPELPKWRQGAVLLACAICYFITLFLTGSFGAYYVILRNHFNVSGMTTAWIGSIQAGITFGAGIFVAPFIDRVGSKRLVQAAGIIMFAGYALSACAPNVYTLFLSYGVLSGVGVAIVYLCAVVEIQRTFPNNVTFAQTMASMGYSGGSVMAGITVPPLIATFGWRGTMMLTAAALLNALAFGCAFIRRRRPGAELEKKRSHSVASGHVMCASPAKATRVMGKMAREALDCSICARPKFLIFCFARFCVRFTFSASIALTPARATSVGLTLAQGTLLNSAYSVATLLFRLVFGVLTYKRQVSSLLIVIIFSASGAAFMTAIAFTTEFYSLLVCYMGCGICIGTTATLMPPIVFELFGMANLARNQALSLLVEGLCFLVAPPVSGLIVDLTDSYFVLFITLAIMLLIGATNFIITFILHKRELRRFSSMDWQSVAGSDVAEEAGNVDKEKDFEKEKNYENAKDVDEKKDIEKEM